MEAELPPNKVVEYGYDALDRRVAKSVDNNPASGSIDRYEYYVWDGDDIVLDFIDPDGTGLGGQPLAFAKRYLWGRGVRSVKHSWVFDLAAVKLRPLHLRRWRMANLRRDLAKELRWREALARHGASGLSVSAPRTAGG